MLFTKSQEEIVEKAVSIMNKSNNVIMDEFNRFNTIDIGNISRIK